MLMNWKNNSLRRITATCLATPFLLVLTAIEPILGKPKQELQPLEFEQQKLPLGDANLNELRQTAQVAPGVTHTVIVRGKQSERDIYTVDVAFSSSSQSALDLARQLKAQGYQSEIKPVLQRAPDDPDLGPLGYLVRVGAFATEAEATSLRDQLVAVGYTGLRVVNTGEDGRRTTGPWVVNVLEVDLKEFKGKISAALATNIVPDNEPLTSIAARTQALAAINGGYFVIGAADGTPGDLAGISILKGNLVSEAVNGRTTLLLQSRVGSKDARVATLKSEQTAIATDGVSREVDGINRKPGLIRGCGGVGGDEPTQNPKHDFTCTDSSELIAFTPAFGQTTEPGEGVEVSLDSSGRVIELRRQRAKNEGNGMEPNTSLSRLN